MKEVNTETSRSEALSWRAVNARIEVQVWTTTCNLQAITYKLLQC